METSGQRQRTETVGDKYSYTWREEQGGRGREKEPERKGARGNQQVL